MKQKSIVKRIAQIAAIALVSATMAVAQAAEPTIVINNIPPIGQNGYAEGKLVWDGLTPANTRQYAVIAMLHAIWPGGGGYYVKPYDNNYLNAVDNNGYFSILLTTGGIDADVDEVIFYFVDRANFNASDGSSLNPTSMTGKYLTTTTIYRSTWVQPPQPASSNISPGFVTAGTKITLSCQQGGTILFTLDGTDPATSSSVQTYNNTVFSVPETGVLLVKTVVKVSDLYSPVSSLLWLPQTPLTTPFWGLDVSLALNGEPFGYLLSETATRERMLPVAKLTQWVRTFGTINNGQEYINKIAKELGLHTMIGLYITNDATNNNAQIDGLRQILQMGPAPDLIVVGNETSLSGVSPATLASCIDAVREMVIKQGLIIPVGSADIANILWSQTVLEKMDFLGTNIYTGTWDNVPENQMLDALKQIYANTVSAFQSKLVLLSETGTPYSGGSYNTADGGTQTASKQKAANYLCGFRNWIQQKNIPAFYFEAYDEPVKSQNGGNPIEQYFGIMDGNMKIHQFYCNCLPCDTTSPGEDSTGMVNINANLKLYPNPLSGVLHLDGIEGCTMKIFTENGVAIYVKKMRNSSETLRLEQLPAGTYFLRVEKDGNAQTVKMIKE